MDYGLMIYLMLLLLSAIVPLFLMIRLLYEEKDREQYIFSIMMVCISIWSLFYLLEIFVDDHLWMTVFTRLRFIGVAFLPVFWLGFSLYYTGRETWLKGKRILILSVVPICTQVIIWLNDHLHLFWSSTELISVGRFEIIFGTTGPWFWIHTIYSYGLVFVGIVLILNFLLKIGDIYIKEALILLIGVATPTFGNSIYILELGLVPKAYDITPITFLVTGIIFTWAVIKLEFLKIKPVARDTIFRNIDDYIFIIDNDDKIVDCNESALSLLNRDHHGSEVDIIGSRIDEVLDKEQLGEVKKSDKSSLSEMELQFDGERRFFDVKISPIFNQRDEEIGRVLILRDITLRKKAEKEAEFLHSMLRHDLGNKLQVTMGFLELVQDTDLEHSQKKYIDTSLESIEEGIELIKDVRMLNKLDIEGEKTDVEISNIISKAVDKYSKVGEDKGIEIINRVNKELDVTSNHVIKEAITNLIENSILHSGGSKIIIDHYEESDKEGDFVNIVIEDDGKGIPDKRKHEVVERGFKGDESKGSGLGMFIADKIVNNYGRGLYIEDSDMGGVKFVVKLRKSDQKS